MLIYVREDEMESILEEPAIESIPQPLKDRFNQENELLLEMKREMEANEECEPVFIITPEIVSKNREDNSMEDYLDFIG